MELFREVLKLNKQYNLIENGDKIIVGFSGGPDSVFLVEMLKKLQEFLNFKIYLVHINHLLRGEDADSDESFSYSFAEKNNLEIFARRIDVKKIAKEVGKTLEEVGREERYKFFKEILEKVSATKIATAHNKDDQIETFLFRLIRGSSLQGLEGIKVKKENIIRPISEIYKKDIIEYLNKNQIQYKIDKTNFENEFTRNSIRLDLIPFIENRYNTKFKDKIYSLINEIRENNKRNIFNIEDYTDNQYRLVLEKIKDLENFNIKNILTQFLNKKNIKINRNKIDEINSLIESGGTKTLDLDKNYRIVKDYTYLYVEKKENTFSFPEENITFFILDVLDKKEVVFNNLKIKISLADEQDKNCKDRNKFVTYVSPEDKIEIRYRKEGDKFRLNNEKTKKIKEIFINEKVPKNLRDFIPLFLFKNEVFWIYGLKKASIPITEKNKGELIQILFTVEEV